MKTTLKDSGSAIIATATGEGENRVTNAIQNALHSPLMKAHDIYSSKRLLIKFMCSKDSKKSDQVQEMAEIHNFSHIETSSHNRSEVGYWRRSLAGRQDKKSRFSHQALT